MIQRRTDRAHAAGLAGDPVVGGGNLPQARGEHGDLRKYGDLKVRDVRQLKELEAENAKLKRIVADLTLENTAIKAVLGKEW